MHVIPAIDRLFQRMPFWHAAPVARSAAYSALREPRHADAPWIFGRYAQDPEVVRYMLWRPHATLAETQTFIACMDDWASGQRQAFILTLRGDLERPIGMLDARVTAHRIDIGYVLARSHWGSGVMSEALATLAQSALSQPSIYRLQATCDTENVASARTLEKAAFAREGRLERHGLLVNLGSEPRAAFLYGRWK